MGTPGARQGQEPLGFPGPAWWLGIRGIRKIKIHAKILCKMVVVIEVSGLLLVQHGWVKQYGYAYSSATHIFHETGISAHKTL